MKLYRVEWTDRDHGTLWSWHGTKGEAEREAKEYEGAEVERVDVPTSKGPLIAWLNQHAADNNG